MIKFDKNIKFGGQGCPPYGAQNKKDKLNLRIDEHKNAWQNHLKYQSGFFILDNGIKAGINEIEKTKNE